jgi:hypothetical protein
MDDERQISFFYVGIVCAIMSLCIKREVAQS